MGQRDGARLRARSALLWAALDEFLDKGFDGASTRSIAARAGLSQPSLFHHFDGKRAVWDELVRIGLEHVAFDREAALADPLSALEALVRSSLDLLRGDPRLARVFVFMSRAGLSGSDETVEAARVTVRDTADVLAEGQRRGEVRPGDPLALAVALWGAVQGIAEMLASEPTYPLPEESWLLAVVVR